MGTICEILENVKDHSNSLENLREEHNDHACLIKDKAEETFNEQYMVS